MWSQLLLCCLVGFAAASDYGWKSNTEYIYKVEGRTLTAIHDVANQYSGMLLKAKLIVRPKSDGKLMAQLYDAKYAQVHTFLPHGWKSEIPESQLQYQQLGLSEKAFQIILKNGVVRDLIVSEQVHNWEANLIKSIVSQIQLDTQGEHVIKSHVNQLPEDESNSGVYKTMEDTVTGIYETQYDITPLPEYILQSEPWLVPMPQMKGDGEFIEIVKNKNFSRGEERVGYHYGFGNNAEWEPSTNQMGDFFSRSAFSRAIISGSLKRYTIQSSATTNKIILSPTLNSEEKGMVVSHLNLTLSNIQQASSEFPEVQQPQHLGNLVYSYDTPFSGEYKARSGKQRDSSEEHTYSSEEQSYQERHQRRGRHPRSVDSEEQSYESAESKDSWTQEQPKLDQPPQSPLLPMYIGYMGNSIKEAKGVNIVKSVEKIAQQIGHEIERPEQIPSEKTLTKFTLLTRMIRTMSHHEIQEAAQTLYYKEEQGTQAYTWKTYRDAVAQAGTGPAFLTIKQWVEGKKIDYEEAAEVVASMAQSVHYPTEEYMRAFYKFVTCDKVKSQYLLNDTAILSYSTLVRQVYVNKMYSHNQYPSHIYGSFRHSSGAKQFVLQEFIPYLKQKLQHSIEQGDSHKILVYIRALGNVAHQKILAAFEPYLEGEKQCSQFQRLQMILALDKLAEVHPKVARSVLYKVYQNAGESQEVRVAAVYQLMRTAPPTSMLQRMAEYTNVDTDEQVNAAVQSAIQSAAQLEGQQYADFAENARSAEPLLTKETYGAHYSRNFLRSYVVDEMSLLYKQNFQSFGSQDSFFPKGIKYYLRAELGGVRNELIQAQAMVSSIDELTTVVQQQTEFHQQKQQQHKQNFQQAEQNQFSSEAIARLLNIQTEEREQLEGNLQFKLGGGATRFFSFNNRTIELLPSVLHEIEEALRGGYQLNYFKFICRKEMTISFPTEMSLPFIYTATAPTLMKVDGKIRASAEPQISSGDKIRKPHTISAQTKIENLFSTKLQTQLGFVTPFDHQYYVSGYVKNTQVYVPINSKIEVDIKNKQLHAEFELSESNKDVHLFHYSSWPFTGRKNLVELESLVDSKHIQNVTASDEPQTQFQAVVGKQTGVAFRINYSSEQQFMDSKWLYDQYQRHDGISALMAPFYDETIHHSKIDIVYDAKQSSNQKVHVRLGYEGRHESEPNNDSSSGTGASEVSKLPQESKARQQKMANMVGSGIHGADISVVDASVEFEGQQKVQYVASAAVARSDVDEKARVLFHLKKYTNGGKPYQVSFAAKARVPNTNGLDFVYALKFDPTSTAQAELEFGEDSHSATKVNFQAKLGNSETRKRYLQSLPRAHECREEIRDGNQALPACANMTAEANLMDRIQIKVQYENVGPKVYNYTQKLYSGLRYLTYFNFDENVVSAQGSGKANQVDLQVRFEPNFEAANVSIQAENVKSHIDGIRVNSWAKQVFAVHPVFPVYTRFMGHLLDYDTYRPICVVDKTAANTFDNKTYPIDIGYAWTVMMQYVPDFARQQGHEQQYRKIQEEQQIEQYAVLVRDGQSGNSQKEVKMTLRTPSSQGQLIEVDIRPSGQQQSSGSSPCAKVFVNQKEYHIDDKKSTEIEGGLLQIYSLPNGEVKVEVRHAFYIIYDGERVKITATHDKLRDAVRGLCGTYSGEEYDDFTSPKNCILRDPREFAATYAIEEQGHVQQYKSRAQKADCYFKDIIYSNVISDYDAGRNEHSYQHGGSSSHRSGSSDSCTKIQTRYVVEDGGNTICFSTRPLPVCKSSCNSSNMIKKSVPVHCVSKSNVSQLWKNQIEQGASPDFSHKSSNRVLKIEVPEACSK